MMAGGDNCEQGFTLIELLIAMAIFAIVVSTVYGAYRATFTVIHGSESRMELSRRGQVAMERIGDDLRSLVAGPGGELRGERVMNSGTRSDRLTFVSAAHLALSRKDSQAGRAVIGYSAEPDEKGGLLNLYRLDRVLLPGMERERERSETPGEILAQGLKEVSFSYVDADGRETEEWDSDQGARSRDPSRQPKEPELPVLVYAKLVFARSAESVAEAEQSEGGVTFRIAVALPRKAGDGE